MKYTLDKVSQDAETKHHVLVFRQMDGEDRLALNVQSKEAQVLERLLTPGGLPSQEVLDHLRNAAARSKGRVVGIQLLPYAERAQDYPALTPVLIVRPEGSALEQAVPASLAHAAAWSLALGLPFDLDDGLLSLLRATVTIIPGEAPAGFQDLLAELDAIDRL